MPAPMIAPPAATVGRLPRVASARPTAATTTATSSEAIVKTGVVVDGVARLVGEHGHEVGGPDAGARAHRRQEHPRQTPRAALMRRIE